MLQLACNSLRREGAMVLLPTMVSTLSVGAVVKGLGIISKAIKDDVVATKPVATKPVASKAGC